MFCFCTICILLRFDFIIEVFLKVSYAFFHFPVPTQLRVMHLYSSFIIKFESQSFVLTIVIISLLSLKFIHIFTCILNFFSPFLQRLQICLLSLYYFKNYNITFILYFNSIYQVFSHNTLHLCSIFCPFIHNWIFYKLFYFVSFNWGLI